MSEELGRSSATKFFEGFRQLASHTHRASGDDFSKGREGFFQPVGRLKKNGGFIARRGFGEFASAATAFDGKESAEEKPIAGKSRTNERRQNCRRSGQNGDGQSALDAGSDQAVPGVGNSWHSRIGDQGHMGAIRHAVRELAATRGFVVPVEAHEWLFDAEMLEEQSAVAGIFRSHEVSRLERLHGAESDILPVADGGWNNAQHEERRAITSLRKGGW
jgi:hypothetical protein